MPLFIVMIAAVEYASIPVYAESEAKAREYLAHKDDWQADGGLPSCGESGSLVVAEVREVKSPNASPWGSDVGCWNAGDEEILVAEAFYGLIDPPTDPIVDGPCTLFDASEEDAWFAALREQHTKFNAARCAPAIAAAKAAK